MNNGELSRQLQKLEEIIKKTNVASGQDLELLSHWAKYVCVLCAGFLENATQELYSSYTKRVSNPAVTNFVVKQLEGVQNPNAEVLVQIARKFNRIWGDNLEQFLLLEGRKDAINTIMSNRHKIAHGDDSGITMSTVKQCLTKIVDVIEFIELQCQ